MKNNEKLINDLENIPDRFLDELQGTTVKKKKFSWRVPVYAAACIAAVAAAPVIISYISKDINTENEYSIASSELETDISEQLSEIPDQAEDVTDEEFPNPYFCYNYVSALSSSENSNGFSEYIYDRDKGTLAVKFLKNKEFENQINNEISELISSLPSDLYHPESPWYYIPEFPEDLEGRQKELFVFPEIKNGYFSVIAAVAAADSQTGAVYFENVHSLVYNLIESRKISSLNEYFGGDNPEKLIQEYCDNHELPGEITGFANTNIICSNGEKSFIVPLDITFAVENNMPFVEICDFSKALDNGYGIAGTGGSAIRWKTEQISYNGAEISYELMDHSSLYSDSWCEKHNSAKKVIMEDMLKEFADNGYDMSDIDTIMDIDFNQSAVSDTILKTSVVCNEKWMKNFYMYQLPHTVMYDADSLERMNISDLFTDEGLEYIYQSALQNGFGTNTDENRKFDSKEKFTDLLNRDILHTTVHQFKEDGIVSVSFCYETEIYDDTSVLEVKLPVGMMNSRYFDYDRFSDTTNDIPEEFFY